jgi:hypothetical protein
MSGMEMMFLLGTGMQVCPIQDNMNGSWSTYLSAVYTNTSRIDVTDKDMDSALMLALAALNYLSCRRIPIY